MFPRLLARTRRLENSYLEQPLHAVPRNMAQIEEFGQDLMNRKGYDHHVNGFLFSTDVHLGVSVPVMFNIATYMPEATFIDLFVEAWVAYAGLSHVVDMGKHFRTVRVHNGKVLPNPYTIFYTPQNVANPKNTSVVTNKGKLFWRGNILVIKHTTDNTPLDIHQDEGYHITTLVRKQLEEVLN
ncbi:hypothetical protein R3P38DRAFT_2794798 [Favolaschia claudopus]|uniref:Uncharacterized protein n=1 Tax=Favolaschia claudopus TaxID=2862362 RepID=A0AAW0A8Q3_9AGAR